MAAPFLPRASIWWGWFSDDPSMFICLIWAGPMANMVNRGLLGRGRNKGRV